MKLTHLIRIEHQPMIPIRLGQSLDSGQNIFFDPKLFQTHLHLIGATGAGKTNAILVLLRSLMLQVGPEKCALFVIDPMGNLSDDLLNFIAHEAFCPQHIRDRLIYIEPAREDVVLPFNPLTFTSAANRYYQVMRAVDLVLRGWSAQDVASQPRLLQWTYKAFCAAAMMGVPIAMCQHLVHPGTEEHETILRRIPGHIRYHWKNILNSRSGEATRILESTRNRLDPFFESPILKAMFGVRKSNFNCQRFIRERKIVILNLAKLGRIPALTANTIGALVLNEVFETASRMTNEHGRSAVEPTYVLLDEFQKYVSVDIQDALPTVRQMGLRMILAHQSFAQLESDEVHLEQMIWQARTRLAFASYAKDADLLADELAKLTFDAKVIKDQRVTKRQLIKGYRKEWLRSESKSQANSSSNTKQSGSARSDSRSDSESRQRSVFGYTSGSSNARSETSSHGVTSGASHGQSIGRAQQSLPIHDTFEEVMSITYESFEEYAIKWGQQIRQLKQGECFLQLPGSADVERIMVDYFPLELTAKQKAAKHELIERNFQSEFFMRTEDAMLDYQLAWQQIQQLPTSHARLDEPKTEEGTDRATPFEL